MNDLTRLIQDLVRIDSVNPALDSYRPGETELARFVLAWAQSRGLETQWLESVSGRPSVIVRAKGSGGGKTLMLNSHLDTVGVTGMVDPFEPRIEDGIMFGRGVMDMKASIAACLMTVEWAANQKLSGDVVFTAVSDEEHASIGTEEALQVVTADAAIVAEPTDLELHLAHRGFSIYEVAFRGKASHTSKPSEGVNALLHLGRLLWAAERHDRQLREREPHPLLSHGSLQPVLAQGGHELFTTPSSALVTLERRTLPGEDSITVRGELESLFERLRAEDPRLQADIRTLIAREPFETPAGSEIEAILADATFELRGQQPQRLGAPYWTDAALVGAYGIPTVLFGPIGGDIHQPTEWLDIASTETVLEVLKRTTARFCA